MMDCRKTVNDMYKFAKKEDMKLLSSFGAENEGFSFWDEYRTKYKKYDKLFNRMFNSFKYFMQEDNQTIDEITEDFTDEVYNHLMINAKKYEELYRINILNDENYSITDNYNITEELTKETTIDDSDTKGSRTDSTASTIGAKNTTESDSYGAKTTTKTDVIGAKETETEHSFGEKHIESSSEVGSHIDTETDDIAGFDSVSWSDDKRKTYDYDSRLDSNDTLAYGYTDTDTVNEGSRSNSGSISEAAHTDSKNIQEGARLNSESFNKGQQIDTYEGTHTEEYVLTRQGNIGVRTITEVLEYHRNFWNTYEFYTYIFKEICAELLSI